MLGSHAVPDSRDACGLKRGLSLGEKTSEQSGQEGAASPTCEHGTAKGIDVEAGPVGYPGQWPLEKGGYLVCCRKLTDRFQDFIHSLVNVPCQFSTKKACHFAEMRREDGRALDGIQACWLQGVCIQDHGQISSF